MGVPPGDLGERAPQQRLPGRMERIRAKQEKYHQERLPGGTGEGQDEARPGESWGVPLIPPTPVQAQQGDRDPSPTPVPVDPNEALR